MCLVHTLAIRMIVLVEVVRTHLNRDKSLDSMTFGLKRVLHSFGIDSSKGCWGKWLNRGHFYAP